MAGGSCCGGGGTVQYTVEYPNGETKTYLTEVEARAAATSQGGTYTPVVR